MGQAGGVSTYRERLTAPLSWWIVVAAFGLVCGWIMLVATTVPIAVASTLLGAVAAGGLVWTYGSIVIEVGQEGLRVGSTRLPAAHVHTVTALDRRSFRDQLGPRADARAWLCTRPYIDTGVRVDLDDPSDPTPYWLVSSRRPEAVAEAMEHALGHTGATTNGEMHGGQEEEV